MPPKFLSQKLFARLKLKEAKVESEAYCPTIIIHVPFVDAKQMCTKKKNYVLINCYVFGLLN